MLHQVQKNSRASINENKNNICPNSAKYQNKPKHLDEVSVNSEAQLVASVLGAVFLKNTLLLEVPYQIL
jgi:hypothetical protein